MSIIDSPAGSRRIKVCFALSLVTTALTACFFLSLGRLIDGHIAPLLPLILAFASALFTVLTGYIAEVGAKKEEVVLRAQLLDSWWKKMGHESRAGSPNHTQHHSSSGRVISLMTDSVERVTNYRQGFIAPLMGAAACPLVVLVIVAIGIDWFSALVLLLFIPIIPLAINGFQKAFKKVSGESRAARAALANRYLESIQGLETLVMLGAAARTEKELAQVGEHNRAALMRLLSRNQLVLFVSDAVFSLACVTTAAVLAAWRFASMDMTFGGAVALVLCAILLIGPLEMIGAFFYVGMGGRASEKAMERFGLGSTYSEAGDVEQFNGTISINGARLGYGDRAVLDHVNLRLPADSTTVITGPSGGGKSTLLGAMKGLVYPQAGEVRVGGRGSSDRSARSILDASALVAQTTWLFSGSVADNLRIVQPDATSQQLWTALKLVDLDSFVRALPQGLDTNIGERGQGLSGGQAQRLSLARALLSGRRIILLDEPTSQVDLESEEVIMRALGELAGTRTLVLVTHRASAQLDGAVQVRVDGGEVRLVSSRADGADTGEINE